MRKPSIENLNIKLFADGADEKKIREFNRFPFIKGFTTNPTLMRNAGVDDYERFARNLLLDIVDKPISFEVFSDEFKDMARQARIINSWGPNVYVKIPITNTRRESAADLIGELLREGIKINVTAILTVEQLDRIRPQFPDKSQSIISVFAGRVADTGRDPKENIRHALNVFRGCPGAEVLWASCRELYNIFEADQVGCHIITVTLPLIAKFASIGLDLSDYSLDTVKMFYQDAKASGFVI
ncbi:MAG: transaldolase [Lentisphaerae bacterium]|nr:transaldolase [Lentisphaerota bacterium]